MYYIGEIAFDGDYLQHYGVQGMHWGVRNYQYYDGTLTPEGRRRYLKNVSRAYRQEGRSRREAKRFAKEDYERFESSMNKLWERRDKADEEYERARDEATNRYEANEDGIADKYDKKMVKRLRERFPGRFDDYTDEEVAYVGHRDDYGDDDAFNMYMQDMEKTSMKDVTQRMAELNKAYRKMTSDFVDEYITSDKKSIREKVGARNERRAQNEGYKSIREQKIDNLKQETKSTLKRIGFASIGTSLLFAGDSLISTSQRLTDFIDPTTTMRAIQFIRDVIGNFG